MKDRQKLVNFAEYFDSDGTEKIAAALYEFADEASGVEMFKFFHAFQRACKYTEFPKYE